MKPNRNIKIPHRIFLFALSLFFCVCAVLILIDYFFFALLWCHFFVTLFLGGGCKGKCKLQTNWLISSQIDFNSSLKCSQFLSVKVFQKCVNARRASAVGGCSLKWKLKKKTGDIFVEQTLVCKSDASSIQVANCIFFLTGWILCDLGVCVLQAQ